MIDGEWRESTSQESYDVMDPSTEERIAVLPKATREDARAAIDAARRAFDDGPWPGMHPRERRQLLEKLVLRLEDRAGELASLESRNAGKPIRQASFIDIPMAIEHTRHFARLTEALQDELVELPDIGVKSRVLREPVGVCAGITPWNFPLLMAVWKIAPALAAGNTIILKPASHTPLTALEYARLAIEAELPRGVLNVVTGPGQEVGEELASNGKVDKVAFTGSTEVGRRIMATAAATVKKLTLELGGKAPMVVLEDADPQETLRGTLFGAYLHQGQVCLAGTRLLLPRKLHDTFLERLIDRTQSIRLGPTASWETDMGPLISEGHRRRVEGYISRGLEEGAELVHGGKRPEGFDKGYYLEPTIFDGVSPDMTIAQEEIFGPVLTVFGYDDEDEAVELANATTYGLGASVWSRDLKQAENVARRIRAGTVWVNHHHLLSCAAPHGGYKQSGFGRELGIWGLLEYTELKHLYLDESGEAMKEAFGLVLPD